jgi:hypothetical protein
MVFKNAGRWKMSHLLFDVMKKNRPGFPMKYTSPNPHPHPHPLMYTSPGFSAAHNGRQGTGIKFSSGFACRCAHSSLTQGQRDAAHWGETRNSSNEPLIWDVYVILLGCITRIKAFLKPSFSRLLTVHVIFLGIFSHSDGS